MWLFPAWIRADRGEEAIGVVLDQVPAGARRLPVRSVADLVRAGLHARRRAIPPLPVLWEVLIADARNRRGLVPELWRPWLHAWLRDPHWKRRYVSLTVVGLIGGLCLLWPLLAFSNDGWVSALVNIAMWGGVIAVMQSGRAQRWRWLIALRNGFVPSDLRSFPAEATTVGVVRPLVPNWRARSVALVVAGGASAIVAANAVATAVLRPIGFGSQSTGPSISIAIAEVVAVFVLFVRPTLRRIGSTDGARPAPPDEALMVDRARTRATRIAWAGVGAFLVAVTGWSAVIDGPTAAILPLGLGAAAWLEVVVVHRREARLGRALGMWEVWPALGPQPFLLVREDVLEAEGLRGPLARSSHPPRSPA